VRAARRCAGSDHSKRASRPPDAPGPRRSYEDIGEEDDWEAADRDSEPEDGEEDVAAGGWAGVVPITTSYGAPLRAPDCDPAIPVARSVLSMTGTVSNRRG
jgi:hypothetical protein